MNNPYQSDNLSQTDSQEEFTYHKPSQKIKISSEQKQKQSHIYDIIKKCEKIKEEILDERLMKTARHVWKSIKQNESKQLIIPLTFKMNQQDELKTFIRILGQLLIQIQYTDKEDEFFKNVVRKFHIHKWQTNDVKELALKIYIQDEQIRLKKDIMIYILSQVSNLKPENVYIFEEGLPHCSYKVIVPTYDTFLTYSYPQESSIEIIPHKLYEPKELFCEFMFKCIKHEKIKAYLPPQSLSLIEDFDSYPISYKQGCRRLIYCIVKYHILLDEKNLIKKLEYVNVGILFTKIQSSIYRIFSVFRQFKSEKVLEKYIQCCLDEKQNFSVFHHFLNKVNWFQVEQKEQVEVVCEIRKKLIEKFKQQKQLVKYIPFLEEYEDQNPKTTRGTKKKRSNKLEINPDFYKSQKDVLEDQITKIIQVHAKMVRIQSRWIKWQDFNFEQRIRPQIPYKIFKGVMEDPKKRKVLNEITCYEKTTLALLVHLFCQSNKNFGQFMYIMKDLQLFGVIDISKKMTNPMVTPNYFPKSSFTLQSRES